MNLRKKGSYSGQSSDTNIDSNSKEIETAQINPQYKNREKDFNSKNKKKKVKFKSKFVSVINVESYKKYYCENESKNVKIFTIPKYKEIHCTCGIY